MKKLTRGQMAALLQAIEYVERSGQDLPPTLMAAKAKLLNGILLYDTAHKALKGDR